MSTLDKMLIKGIRSYSPDNNSVITFYRPLTLVVGPNGAGKTTVIECLKNACTGELPPNSRSGQTFIHDPKVAGQTETKGQIKLRFRTAAGKDVVCIRSFQLTQKASKMEYKAIESVLQTVNNHTGEKVCLSYRCADMDREVPMLMGVSKAILENVIFVHQDEANWPLAEPMVLKKKFDDIFSATRYTKALDVMKKLHKEQSNEIKMHKLKLENLQTLKDAAFKLQGNIESDQSRAAALQSQIQPLEQNIQDCQSRIGSLEAVLEELRQLQSKINYKEGERNSLLKLRVEQYDDLEEENEDSDEDLAKWQAMLQERLRKLDAESKELERASNDAATKSTMLSGLITKCSEAMGKLQGEEEAHVQDRRKCEELIREFFSAYSLGSVPGGPLDDKSTSSCIARIAGRLNELKEDFKQLKEFNSSELLKSRKNMEDVGQRYSDASGRIEGNNSQKLSVQRRLTDLHEQLRDYPFVDDQLKEVEEKIASLGEELRKLCRKIDEKDYDAILRQARVEKQMLEQKLKSLRQEKLSLERDSSDRQSLKAKKAELTIKERELKRMMDDNKDKFRQVLKAQPREAKTVKSEVESAYSKSKQTHEELMRSSREADVQEAQVRGKLDEAKTTLAKQRSERDAKKRALLSKISAILQADVEISAYPSQLQEAQELKESKKSQHDMADGMRRTFEPFERFARSAHACPCCERSFTASEEDEFVAKQRSKRSNAAERLQELATQFTIAESRAQQLEKLRPIYEEYQKLEAELIPRTEKVLEDLTQEHERCKEHQYDASCVVVQSKQELEVVEDLRLTAETIDNLQESIERQSKQVEELEVHLSSQSMCARSAEDVEEEIRVLDEKLDDLNRKMDKLKDEQDYMKDDEANLRRRLHAEDVRKGEIMAKVAQRNALIDQQSDLSQQLLKLEAEIQVASEQLEPLTRERERQRQEYNLLEEQFAQQESSRQNEVMKLEKEFFAISQVWQRISTYVKAKKPQELENAKRKFAELQAQKEEEEKRRNTYILERQKVITMLADQDKVANNILQNIKYRKTCAEEAKCLEEIRALEQNMQAIGKAADFEADLRAVTKEKQTTVAEVSRHRGTMGAYESSIARNKQELKQTQYKDITKRYRKQLVEMKTLEMANKDLDKYYRALDRALMRFHTMKMEEINKIIKELWQQTYRGQDIDYIEIRADNEGAGSRSYAYRVVMSAGDAELDMRGRCSAGQKVLAALIIRLALAETFCLNCGILTLDEPTTNLDARNAESFAAALVRILEERKAQENFQLVVITHDERFAQLIGQRQLAEKYYRVSKDENQHSVIEAQDIFD